MPGHLAAEEVSPLLRMQGAAAAAAHSPGQSVTPHILVREQHMMTHKRMAGTKHMQLVTWLA